MRISLGCLGELVLCNDIVEWMGLGAIVLAEMVAPESYDKWILPLVSSILNFFTIML